MSLQDKILDLESKTSSSSSSVSEIFEDTLSEDNVLKPKNQIVRKRKVRILKNAKHLKPSLMFLR